MLIIGSCKPSLLILNNKYVYHPFGYSLILGQDSTFQYKEFMGSGGELISVSGVWQIKGNKLFIDSRDTLMLNPLPLRVQESETMGSSKTFISNIDVAKLYINWMLIVDEKIYPFQKDSILRVWSTSEIKQFYLKAIRNSAVRPLVNREKVTTQSYVIQNENSNHIIISIPLSYEDMGRYATYELLTDTLTIKKNKLIWPRKNVVLKFQKR
jgi:hypothetical protein